jgi:uncharacterized protein (TIGR03435 family)
MGTEELLALGVIGRGSRLGDRIEVLLKRGREFSPRASMVRVAVSALVLLALVVAGSLAPRWIAFAQQPAFEVASVRPNKSGGPGPTILPPKGGRLTATNVSVQDLLITAYHVQRFQVSGGPRWLESDRFDIEAKTEGDPPRERIQLMLQSLLADRFNLALHRETRELPVYELVLANRGPKLNEGTCVGTPSFDNLCGGFRMSFGALMGRVVAMPQLARTLANLLSRTVVDKTGLTGNYDFDLKWIPDDSASEAGAPPLLPDSAGPSIFTALREQLGLELKPAKGPVEVLIIDHAEKPDAN